MKSRQYLLAFILLGLSGVTYGETLRYSKIIKKIDSNLPDCNSDFSYSSGGDVVLWDSCKGTSGQKNETYEGEYDNGKFNGIGKIRFVSPATGAIDSNNLYLGEFRDGQFNGFGQRILNSGKTIREGEYINNQLNGLGIIINDSVLAVLGEFKDGKENGNVIYFFEDGGINPKLTGFYKDGKLVTPSKVNTKAFSRKLAELAMFKRDIQTAIDIYSEMIDDNDLYAMNAMGEIYRDGKYVTLDLETAVTLFKAASIKGFPAAQRNLGMVYGMGIGVKKDLEEFRRLIKLAAESGDAWAQTEYGLDLWHSGKKSDGFRWMKAGADQGDSFAQIKLAEIFRSKDNGFIKQDVNEGLRLLKLAAVKRDTLSYKELGWMYFHGVEVKKDYSEAMRMFHLAAALGDQNAQLIVGDMFFNGEGLSSRQRGGNHTQNMSALYWYKKSAEQGNSGALFKLGYMYAEGFGDARSYLWAYVFSEMADKAGNKDAKKNLIALAKQMNPRHVTRAQEMARACEAQKFKNCWERWER
jgi:TPR repeat protein